MIPLLLEQLSISMEEGVVVRWLAEDGATVRKGEIVVEVETDKSTVEIEAPADGVLTILVAAGTTVPVDTELALLRDAGELDVPAPSPFTSPSPSGADPGPRTAGFPGSAPAATVAEASGDGICSPAARRIARELGVDLASVLGSGPGGRVLAADVQRAAAAEPFVSPPTDSARAVAGTLRDLVVASLSHSWQTVPHIHIAGELDGEGLALAKAGAPAGTTVTDLLVLVVASALQDVPDLNGLVAAEGGRRQGERVHLAVAVAGPEGVVAPVLRDVGSLTLAQVSAERARLVAAARGGALEKRDLGGATCTLSNLGAYPVDFFAPVITTPQIALIAIGRLVERPAAVNGMLAVRRQLWVNAAIDHRGADGEAGGRFLAALENRIAELPARLLKEAPNP